VHPRLLACLLPAIALAMTGAIWALVTGWGWFAAILFYSVGGSVALVALCALALLLEARDERTAPGPRALPVTRATPAAARTPG
jgi:hypothetical protein